MQPPLNVNVTLACVPARAAFSMKVPIASGSIPSEILEPVRRQGGQTAVLVIESSLDRLRDPDTQATWTFGPRFPVL